MRTTDELVEEWNAETMAECSMHRLCEMSIRKDLAESVAHLDEMIGRTEDDRHRRSLSIIRDALERYAPEVVAGAEACYMCGIRGKRQEEILATLVTARIMDDVPDALSVFESAYVLYEGVFVFIIGFEGKQDEEYWTERRNYWVR